MDTNSVTNVGATILTVSAENRDLTYLETWLELRIMDTEVKFLLFEVPELILEQEEEDQDEEAYRMEKMN